MKGAAIVGVLADGIVATVFARGYKTAGGNQLAVRASYADSSWEGDSRQEFHAKRISYKSYKRIRGPIPARYD